MKKLILTAIILSSMSLNAFAKTSDKTSFESIVAEAKSSHIQAQEMHNIVWKQKKMKHPYVEHFLKKADEAIKKGDKATAMKMAQRALITAQGELRQAKAFDSIEPSWLK